VISAPAQTVTPSAENDDDDILAKLQKYEAEVKKDNPVKQGTSLIRKLKSHGYG